MACRREVFLAVAEQYQAAVEKDSKKYGECLARLRVRHVTVVGPVGLHAVSYNCMHFSLAP